MQPRGIHFISIIIVTIRKPEHIFACVPFRWWYWLVTCMAWCCWCTEHEWLQSLHRKQKRVLPHAADLRWGGRRAFIICLFVSLSGFQSEPLGEFERWKPPLCPDCLSCIPKRQGCWNTAVPERIQTSCFLCVFMVGLWAMHVELKDGDTASRCTRLFIHIIAILFIICTYSISIMWQLLCRESKILSLPLKQEEGDKTYILFFSIICVCGTDIYEWMRKY